MAGVKARPTKTPTIAAIAGASNIKGECNPWNENLVTM